MNDTFVVRRSKLTCVLCCIVKPSLDCKGTSVQRITQRLAFEQSRFSSVIDRAVCGSFVAFRPQRAPSETSHRSAHSAGFDDREFRLDETFRWPPAAGRVQN